MKAIANQARATSWWVLGLSCAVAAGTSSNPLFLTMLCLAIVGTFVLFREGEDWARTLRFYLIFCLFVITVRVLFRFVFTYGTGGIYAPSEGLNLPSLEIQLGALGEVQFFGGIAYSTISAALTDGLRMAAVILSIGIASTLGEPRSLLRVLPSAFRDIAAALSIALNLAPQLVISAKRIQLAARLRGRSHGINRVKGWIIPTLEDTLEKSMALAASMDARGFGRSGTISKAQSLVSKYAALASAALLTFGTFALLVNPIPNIGLVTLIGGLALLAIGIRAASVKGIRTNYRAQIWHRQDSVLFAISIAMAVAIVFGWFR